MKHLWRGLLAGALVVSGVARADVAPPDLRGCERRPLGSVCYVKNAERGVCARIPGGDRPVCAVLADPAKAPPPPTVPDPPTSLPPEPLRPGEAPDPFASQQPSSSCALAAPGVGSRGGKGAAITGALLALGLALRSRRRPRARAQGARR